MTFAPGQEVICIDDSPRGLPVRGLKKGETYHVLRMSQDWWGQNGVLLVELDPGLYPGWHIDRFRPVVKRKTDITVFTQMLTKEPAHA